MIFVYTLQNVLAGKKTQTRRLAREGERLVVKPTPEGDVTVIETAAKRVMYQTGRTYAVQPGRGKKAVARMRITDLKCECVEDVTLQGARAEGYPSRQAFLDVWHDIYGKEADLSVKVWVISFKMESKTPSG